MKRILTIMAVALFASVALPGCFVAPGPPEYEVDVAPPLPAVVELDAEPYYVHGGYHYYYHDNRWQYARSRGGPWRELPRSHWPRETRFRGGGRGEGGYERR